MERNILDFIESHLKAVVPIEKEFNEARWKRAVHGRPSDDKKYSEKRDELETLYSDRESYARILTYDDGDLTETPETARQLRLLRLSYAAHQMPKSAMDRLKEEQDEVERVIGDHRVVIDDEEWTASEVAETLQDSDDKKQRAAIWESMQSIGDELGPLLLRVVGIRNRAARELDYRNYYRLGLELQEIDEKQLLLTLEEVLKATEEPYKKLKTQWDRTLAKRFKIRKKDLRPWHYSEPIFPGAPHRLDVDIDKFYGRKSVTRIAETFFKEIGFDVKPILNKSDLGPREGKTSREFCLHVDRSGKDVRILSTLGNGAASMRKILRHLGAAIYYRHLGNDLSFIVRKPAHPLLVESVSMLMGRLVEDPEFLKQTVKAPKATVVQSETQIEELRRFSMLLMARWVPVLVFFERALYDNPGQDLNRTWWTLVDQIMHIDPPEGREGRHDWAAELSLALDPLSSHNQLLGPLVASQMRAKISEELGDEPFLGNEKVGDFLKERLFAQGSREDWSETLIRVTGEGLSPRYFFEEHL